MQNEEKNTTQNEIHAKVSKPLGLENFSTGSELSHYVTISLLLLLVIFSVLNVFYPHLFWYHFQFSNYALHSAIEAAGAVVAILMGFLPIELMFRKPKPSYTFISFGFLSMGIWDLFHSIIRLSDKFVFTHTVALLSGGIFFALILFPWGNYIVRKKKPILFTIAIIMIIFAADSTINSALVPKMIQENSFTSTSKLLNLIAGVLFLITAVKLLSIYVKNRNIGELILVFVASLSAIAGIIFPFSDAWTDSWWVWHFIRLIAFVVVIAYLFWRVQRISHEKSVILNRINQQNNQLFESEERFRLAMLATNQGIWDWNVPKNKVYFSPIWKAQVGYKDTDIENDFDNWVKLLHPEDKDRCLKAVDDYLKNPNGNFILEFRFKHKRGHYIWIHNEASAVLNDDGQVVRMFGAHTDITEQKNAQDELKLSLQQFRIVFEDSALGKSMTRVDGSLRTNKAFSDITGYTHEEIQEKNWKEITHPDDIKESEKVIQRLITGEKESIKFEKRYLHKKGHYIWTEVNTTLHKDLDGKPLFFITTINDITKRKEIENSLKEKEEKFRGLFENDPTAILIADPVTGLLTDVNPAAERLMEMSRDELIGMHQSQLHPEDIMEQQVKKFKSLEVDPTLSIDSEIITKNKVRKPVEIRVSMVEINKKPHLIGIFHDVSQLVQKQQELKESEEKHRAIFESATDAFIIANLEGIIVEVNPSACEVYGYPYKEIIGKSVMELIHPDYQPKFAQFKESIEKTGSYSGSTIDVRKDGSTFYTEVHGSVIMFNKQPHLLAAVRDITKEKEAKNRILASERKFKNLFNSVSIPLCYVNENGDIESMNNRFRQELGYQETDIPHIDDWWRLAYPDSRYRKWVMNNWNEAVQKSIENKTDIKSDIYDVTCKDGSIKKMIIAGITIENDVLATFIDVTQEKEAEEKIIREKEFSDAVINSMPGVFYLFGEDGKFIKWNNLMADTAGIPAKKMSEKTPLDVIAPEHHDKIQKAIQTVFTEGEVFVEADFYAKGQKNIPYYFTGKRIMIDNDPYLLGMGVDISKRKLAEKEKEKALAELQERMKEITCLFNVNETIKNPKTSIPEVMQAICDFIPPGWQYSENTSAEIVLDKIIYQTKNYKESEHVIIEKIMLDDTERGYIKVSAHDLNKEQLKKPFLKEEKNLLKAIAASISIYINRIEYLVALHQTSENLKNSNKELEQFAYVASHDLQEPLRMVSSYTQLIERKYKGQLDERADKYIHYAVDGANRMQNLINDLLVFSRVSTKGDQFKKADANDMVDEALKDLSMVIKENEVTITRDKLPEIKADRGQLERVFYNLINNAIKFRKEDEKPKIHISALKKDGKWLFSVQDNGIGIEEKFKEKIFVIFQRLHGGDKYKGTGIGLALCKRIVNRHGGDIWFESIPNQGTTFYFTINDNNLN